MDKEILNANLNALSKTNKDFFNFLKTFDWRNKNIYSTLCDSMSGENVPVYSKSAVN
jgi:hypothetical protein